MSNSTQLLNSFKGVLGMNILQLSVGLSLFYVCVLCLFRAIAMNKSARHAGQEEADDEVARCKCLIQAIDKEARLYRVWGRLFRQFGILYLTLPLFSMFLGLLMLMALIPFLTFCIILVFLIPFHIFYDIICECRKA